MIVLPRDSDPLARYESTPLLNHRAPLLGLTITFVVFSWICSLLRLYVRFVVQRAPGWDDFFIILTMLFTTIGSTILCILTNMGIGTPIWTMDIPDLQQTLKIIYIGTATYPLSSTFIKIALLLQYLRVFTGRRIRILCKWTLAFTVLTGIAFAICSWFPCFPVNSFWDFSIQGRCWGFASRDQLEFMRIMVTQVVVTAALDLVVLLIPGWLYFQPDTTGTARLSLLGLFVLGLSANVCSLWRVVYIIKMSVVDKGSFDPVWDNPSVMGLASYEVHLAAVCAGLPIFWPVLKKTWNRIMVTFEVSVREEYREEYEIRPTRGADVELHSAASDRNLAESTHEGWEPFVGDETTGLGKNQTVVESRKGEKWSKKAKEFLAN